MKIGINEPSAKTNRLPDCCRWRHWGGPFFLALALARTTRTGIGRRPLTKCGRMSTIASVSSRRNEPLALARKRLPTANGSLMRTLFVHASRRPPARRPLAQPNVFFTSTLPSNVRGRLHVANATLTSSLLVANASLRHGRWRPPKSSSCGSAADASFPGSLARPRGDRAGMLRACAASNGAASTGGCRASKGHRQ
jgi:hypothetical protein